jgi:hypothetical protein
VQNRRLQILIENQRDSALREKQMKAEHGRHLGSLKRKEQMEQHN